MKESTDPIKTIGYLLSSKTPQNNNLPAPLEWGRTHEETAVKAFLRKHRAEHRHLQFQEMGLVIDSFDFFLGASPDGKVNCTVCGEFLLEIKCPFAHRLFDSDVAAIHKKCYRDDEGVLHLDPLSTYYPQIQGQLAICRMSLCKLGESL